MNSGKYVFSQFMGLVSSTSFQTIVDRYSGDYKVRSFSCWKQFLCMSFGQLTHRESISDTMICLGANGHKLYHLGIGKIVALSTITRANEVRSYKIYEDLAMLLIEEATELLNRENRLQIKIDNDVFAIDATTIDLCLSTFFWATWRKSKAGIRLHTQFNLKTSIPEFIWVTKAKVHDVNVLDIISFQENSFYVMDKGYIDYKRLYRIHQSKAFFISRAKDTMSYRRLYSHPKDKQKGILYDQTIRLYQFQALKDYPEKLRIIKFKDDLGNTLVFLTNNFNLSAAEIAVLYKARWDIELFFKWIKQHLKIKSFWGQSENAVKTQIWIAISAYVLVAIAKKRFEIKNTPYEILQILSISMFEKIPINQLFQPTALQNLGNGNPNQLTLFDL